MSEVIIKTSTVAPIKSGSFLNEALKKVNKFLPSSNFNNDLPIGDLVGVLNKYDTEKAMNVAKVLAYSSTFNQGIQEVLKDVRTADRYQIITKEFDGIRNDLKSQAVIASKDKIGLLDKFRIWYNSYTKGTIAKRFGKIRTTYVDVAEEMNKQITYENGILDAYVQFRLALKAADIEANEILKVVADALEVDKNNFTAKQNEVDQLLAQGADANEAELERDQLKIKFETTNKDYQIAKDIADNLKVSYNASEAVFTRIRQATDVKQQLFQKSVIFFQTNETVFSGLATAFAAIRGVREGTKTLEAMTTGINNSLEDLASIGNNDLKEGIRVGYGATIKSESIGKLVDAIVAYQQESVTLIAEARNKATQNAQEIEKIVQDGKTKFAQVIQQV